LDLELKDAGRFYGSPHELDLIMCRGNGECNIDWSDPTVHSRLAKFSICDAHYRFLGSDVDWEKHPMHQGRQRLHNVKNPKFKCTFPEDIAQRHDFDPKLKEPVAYNRFLQKEEAYIVLKRTGFLVHSGLRKN
jgi:hypothetical protein